LAATSFFAASHDLRITEGICDSNAPAKLSIQKTFSHPLQFQLDVRCTSSRKLQHRWARLGGSQAIAIRSVPKTINMHISIFLRCMRGVQQAIQLQ
jgi:hypothetical protein